MGITSLRTSVRHAVQCAYASMALLGVLGCGAATAQTTQKPKPAPQAPVSSPLPSNEPATSPAVTFAPTILAFSSQAVGTTSGARTITMSNNGTAALTVTGITVTGSNIGEFAEMNNCPGNLAPSANCTISVTFKPAAVGTSTGAITIADNATGSPQTFTLTGTGSAATKPTIKSVAVYPQAMITASQTTSTTSQTTTTTSQTTTTASQTTTTASQVPSTQAFLLEITGEGFGDIADIGKVFIAVLPATGVAPSPIPALSLSLDKTTILAQFTAPTNYALEEVALSTGSNLLPFNVGASSCDFNSKVSLIPQLVPKGQAGIKYGNGVAKNFYAIQISIVNECPMAIVVPLAGILVVADEPSPTQAPSEAAATNDASKCTENASLVAFSLDHVTSIYSADRKLTGGRAIYFNILQAAATIGSAVEPYFAPGFTAGVAILGGGFTTASKEIFVDMSAEQLQNLTSQSFGATEQVASHGSLQKFVFIRRNQKCKNDSVGKNLLSGKYHVSWQLSPASAEAPKSLTAPATSPASTSAPKGSAASSQN